MFLLTSGATYVYVLFCQNILCFVFNGKDFH